MHRRVEADRREWAQGLLAKEGAQALLIAGASQEQGTSRHNPVLVRDDGPDRGWHYLQGTASDRCAGICFDVMNFVVCSFEHA